MQPLVSYASDSDEEEATNSPPIDSRDALSDAKLKPRPERSRLQIKVAQVDTATEEPRKDEAASVPSHQVKRTAMGGSNPTHSLLSGLPAPRKCQQSAVALPASEAKNQELSANINEAEQHGDSLATAKKENASFREMLGLAPRQRAAVEGPDAHVEAAPKAFKRLRTSLDTDVPNSLLSSGSAGTPAETEEPNAPTAKRHQTARQQGQRISAAPDVSGDPGASLLEDVDQDQPEPAETRGWQRNPDGSWFPATPSAMEEYERYQNEMLHGTVASQPYQVSDDGHVVDVNTNSLESAAQAGDSTEGEPSKFKGRARHKGQLSALVSYANGSKDDLEQKWARQRQGMANARQRYGF